MIIDVATNLRPLVFSSNKNYLIPRKTSSFVLGDKLALKVTSNNGVIIGTVKEKGVPVSRRVFCYSRDSGALVASTVSNADGYYQFSGLAINPDYYVVSLDKYADDVQYNAVAQDLIRAKKVTI